MVWLQTALMAVELSTAVLILFQSMRLYGTLRPGVGGKRFTLHTLRHRHIASLIRQHRIFLLIYYLTLKYISLDVHSNGMILPAHIHCIANDSNLSLLFILIWKILLLSKLLLICLLYALA
jgi:hypothetical protein